MNLLSPTESGGAIRLQLPQAEKSTRPGQRRRSAPIAVEEVGVLGSAVTVIFDQPIILDGVPQYLTNVANAQPITD
jgi:hypothetical protein